MNPIEITEFRLIEYFINTSSPARELV